MEDGLVEVNLARQWAREFASLLLQEKQQDLKLEARTLALEHIEEIIPEILAESPLRASMHTLASPLITTSLKFLSLASSKAQAMADASATVGSS